MKQGAALTERPRCPYTESEAGDRAVAHNMSKPLTNTPIVVPEAVRRKAGLRRGERLQFKVSGRSITIVPKAGDAEAYPMATVMRIIKQEREHPMSTRELAALDRELKAYGAKQAKKAGIKEREIPRIIHESRARRRNP